MACEDIEDATYVAWMWLCSILLANILVTDGSGPWVKCENFPFLSHSSKQVDVGVDNLECHCKKLTEVAVSEPAAEGCAAEATLWLARGFSDFAGPTWIAFHVGDSCVVERCTGHPCAEPKTRTGEPGKPWPSMGHSRF